MTSLDRTPLDAAREEARSHAGTPILEAIWPLVVARRQSASAGGEVHLALAPVDERHALLSVVLRRGAADVRALLERPVRAACEHREGWTHVEASADERLLVRADIDPRGTVRLIQAPVLYELGFAAGALEAPDGRLARSARGAAAG